MLAGGLLVGIALLAVLLARTDRRSGGGAPLIPSRRPPDLMLSRPGDVPVFSGVEIVVQFPEELRSFNHLPATQLHDAYDADRNGVYAELTGEFIHAAGDRRMEVPGFAMKDQPHGLWSWRLRWTPDRVGDWQVTVRFRGRAAWNSDPVNIATPAKQPITVVPAPAAPGFWRLPTAGENPHFLREQQADGTSTAIWLFGNCRAWNVDPLRQDPVWTPHEWIDRELELLPALRANGFNLLNQWMAPWEFLLVHHDRAEFWRQPDGSWKRIAMPNQIQWTPHQYIDQGRAKAFDALVAACEGDGEVPIIRLLLAPLPHACFQTRGHPWGAEGHSGFSPENDRSGRGRDRLLGLSGFRPGMWIWDFFDADPRQPLADWRSQLFDHQANYFRYLIARWGYSRAIGLWVIMDELEGVGDHIGIMAERSGWWRFPQCERWLGDIVRLFRGKLTRSDGRQYAGDPFGHPLHAATTSAGGQGQRGGNLDWQGGPAGARVDVLGWHWYPQNPDTEASWTDQWLYVIDGVTAYTEAPGDHVRLISEFGAMERSAPTDAPVKLHPTLYHHAIWAGIFSGLAGTPMDWDDGKEFGELQPRRRPGIFSEQLYPVDHAAEMRALRTFLNGLSPDDLTPTQAPEARLRFETEASTRVLGLYDRATATTVHGWLFAAQPDATEVSIHGLRPGDYRLVWYDAWTGKPINPDKPETVAANARGQLTFDPGPVLKKLAPQPASSTTAKPNPGPPGQRRKHWRIIPGNTTPATPQFPADTRCHKGHDLAFRLTPAPR